MGSGDQEAGNAALAEPISGLFEVGVGADGRGSGLHDVFGSRVLRRVGEISATESSEHDALVVDDDIGSRVGVEARDQGVR